MKKNVKLSENYFLTTQEVNSEVTVEVAKKTNHIFVVDVSGSMYYELPLIRTQLKNKLSNLMKEGDTISIVWFSGSRDAGILKEEVEVKSLKTLTDLHDAIDRWLRPVGLTAFLKPLQLVKELVGRIQNHRPDSVFSMIFLTDGYNNDCPWNEVISTLKSLETDIASSTFVEYGYYADTQKLTQMAAVLGGEKISCDGFDDF
jgi:Mg-chelatase subunit ChlD